MTEFQINDLLCDLKFTDEENDAFMEIINYAKVCQETNEMENLKTFISTKVDKLVSHED